MTNTEKHDIWLELHKTVMLRVWDDLPWPAREVIARDLDKSSRSFEYFNKYVNKETDRLYRQQFKNEV